MIGELAGRVKKLEDSNLVRKTRDATVLAIITAFWVVTGGLVYNQLNKIGEAINKLNQLEQNVGLMQYRQSQQDIFNNRVMATEVELRRDIDIKFRRIEDQLSRIYLNTSGGVQ